jgi:Zn-dependent protease
MRYELNSRKVTYQELCYEAPKPLAMIGWVFCRLFRLPGSTEIAPVDELSSFRVEQSEVDPELIELFQPWTDDLKRLGFKGTLWFVVKDESSQTTLTHACFLHSSGKALARLRLRHHTGVNPPKRFFAVEYVTLQTDGHTIVTASGKADLDGPEKVQAEYHGEMEPDELWEKHKARLHAAAADNKKIAALKSGKHVVLAVEHHHRLLRDEMVQRGVFEPVKNVVIDGEKIDVDNPVLAEVRKQEANTQNWTSSLLLLVVSAGLFYAGMATWSVKQAAMLLGILFFHEMGPYVVMRGFNYRGLKMFFIPFLGAAVSGRNYNVEGWQRVLVSLAGPVPGIIVGVVIGTYGIVQDVPLALEVAVMLLLLNGFNLLPSLPLDGGWVMHSLLFSRFSWLDIGFRAIAAVCLMGLSALIKAKILFFVGLAMLFAIPTNFKTIQITSDLKEDPDFNPPIDDARIPAEAVSRITDEIDKKIKSGLNARSKAGLVLQVYEALNTKPPGWLATFFLGGVYLTSVATAIIAAGIFVVAQNADLGDLIANAGLAPQVALDPEKIRTFPPNAKPADLVASESVVLVQDSVADCDEKFASLAAEFQQAKSIQLGSAIIVPIEADQASRDRWLSLLESGSGKVHIDREGFRTLVYLQCLAPDASKASELVGSLSAMNMIHTYRIPGLISPWSPDRKLTDDEIKARSTYSAATERQYQDIEELGVDHYEAIDEAERRGDTNKVAELRQEQSKHAHSGAIKNLNAMRDEGLWDNELLTFFEESLDETFANSQDEPEWDEDGKREAPEWLKKIAEKMGQLNPDSNDEGYQMNTGTASSNGPIVNVNFASFDSLGSGTLAFIRWLESEGCTQFKIGFQAY